MRELPKNVVTFFIREAFIVSLDYTADGIQHRVLNRAENLPAIRRVGAVKQLERIDRAHGHQISLQPRSARIWQAARDLSPELFDFLLGKTADRDCIAFDRADRLTRLVSHDKLLPRQSV